MTERRHAWVRVALLAALPVTVSAAWMPLRDHLPNTDLALVLVLVIGAVGWLAGFGGTVASALTAGLAFDFLDTPPYGTLAMSRGSDALTATILVLTGLLVGSALSVLGHYCHSEDHRADALAVVMEASGLVATGEERQLVTAALSTELIRELELADCIFHPRPPRGTNPTVARDGSLVGLIRVDDRSQSRIDLPVWSQGEVVGHYRLVLGRKQPTRQELRVALSLADQAGASMAGHRPIEHVTPVPPRPQ